MGNRYGKSVMEAEIKAVNQGRVAELKPMRAEDVLREEIKELQDRLSEVMELLAKSEVEREKLERNFKCFKLETIAKIAELEAKAGKEKDALMSTIALLNYRVNGHYRVIRGNTAVSIDGNKAFIAKRGAPRD